MTADERSAAGPATWVARLALAAVATVGALWVARSLLDAGPPQVGRWSGAGQPAPSAAASPGLYVVHPDPRVGYVSRPGATYTIHAGVVTTDDLGLRNRPGPAAAHAGEALDVVVLGDSIAFGFGLDDDEVLAHRLELLLSAQLERPVVCRTVATSGWNQRNATAFLRDHADRLPADLVIAIPVGNDVLDTDGVLTSGLRRWAPDPFQRHPLVPVYQGLTLPLRNRPRGVSVEELVARAGPDAIGADLTPSSSARHDDNAALLLELEAWLGERGGRLVVMPYGGAVYGAHLARRLIEAGSRAPIVPLGFAASREHQLPTDAHPNAATTEAFAVHVARTLATEGLVDGLELDALPEVAEASRPALEPALTRDEWVAASDEARAEARAALRSRVELATLEGMRQLVGGVNPDGTLQAELIAVVAGAGDVLEVELAALERADLAPLVVDVSLDDVPLGRLALVEPGASVAARWDVAPSDEPREVRLSPRAWVVRETEGVRHIASCRLVRVELRD